MFLARKGQKFRVFSLEYKQQAVKMYLSGMSKKAITRELGLCSNSYIRRWVKTYQESGWSGLESRRGQGGAVTLGKMSSRNPELKIKWLEAEVSLLKKIAAWQRGSARRRYCFPSSEN